VADAECARRPGLSRYSCRRRAVACWRRASSTSLATATCGAICLTTFATFSGLFPTALTAPRATRPACSGVNLKLPNGELTSVTRLKNAATKSKTKPAPSVAEIKPTDGPGGPVTVA
jgi:hypothetical protein